jgi:hypothetical protein
VQTQILIWINARKPPLRSAEVPRPEEIEVGFAISFFAG